MDMLIFNPDKPFFKGNLHCHTTNSDGKLTPEECKAFYREHGYDFLSITDHRKLSEETHMEDGMLVLCGMEMDYYLPGEVVHLVGVGLSQELNQHDVSRNMQSYIDLANRYDGRVIIAHPAWSLNTVTTLSGLHGLYNHFRVKQDTFSASDRRLVRWAGSRRRRLRRTGR